MLQTEQQKSASHGERPFFCVREAIGILKYVWKPRKGQEKIPFSPNATVVATTAQGGSKKKCFSNALRHTLVVLEMH